jgi:uncharacterized protein YlxW (UPF0749 family)
VLERFVADATEDDYPDGPAAEPTDGHGLGWWAALGGLVVGVLVAVGLAYTSATAADRDSTRAALEERVEQADARVAELRDVVDTSTVRVSALQDDLLVGVAAASEFEQGPLTGEVQVLAGPGAVVTVTDAPGAEAGSLNRVLDRDLQDIVNALWREGARGIAVDDERLTARSAIRSAGEAILVNYRPLQPPYVVTALGVQVEEATQGILDRLARDYGLVITVERGDVALPAAAVPQPRFAQVGEDTP